MNDLWPMIFVYGPMWLWVCWLLVLLIGTSCAIQGLKFCLSDKEGKENEKN